MFLDFNSSLLTRDVFFQDGGRGRQLIRRVFTFSPGHLLGVSQLVISLVILMSTSAVGVLFLMVCLHPFQVFYLDSKLEIACLPFARQWSKLERELRAGVRNESIVVKCVLADGTTTQAFSVESVGYRVGHCEN